jgi:hypothetical protein
VRALAWCEQAPSTQPATPSSADQGAATDKQLIGRSEQHTMRELVIDTETTGLDSLGGQAAWQQAVMQIAAEIMRMRWDERIPEDFAQVLRDKGVLLCDMVYEARRPANA